ncbi:MAG: hypothetical protein WDN03_13555 [Rhizomicrobium sp.]
MSEVEEQAELRALQQRQRRELVADRIVGGERVLDRRDLDLQRVQRRPRRRCERAVAPGMGRDQRRVGREVQPQRRGKQHRLAFEPALLADEGHAHRHRRRLPPG